MLEFVLWHYNDNFGQERNHYSSWAFLWGGTVDASIE